MTTSLSPQHANRLAHIQDEYDLVIVGGGINGCGVARDAAGRGLSVLLCEKDDLAQATSSASTKLFHGGLRYLEYYEFRLVREALKERETLLKAMPHISWPLRFVLPHHKGLRPAWMLRVGLFLYDHLGGREILPASRKLKLSKEAVGKPLKSEYKKAFEYSDCWVEDSRLVVLNARDAADRGATIMTRVRCDHAERAEGFWQVDLSDQRSGETRSVRAKGIVNAGGPWVENVLKERLCQDSSEGVRLVRGSHIVTRKLFDHDQPYIFQQSDGRIIFAIPYETDFTLIGTTDQDHQGSPGSAECTDEERDYLLKAASEYFTQQLTPEDVVWRYSGVRPLYDDNASSASAATREYVLSLKTEADKLPLLNIFGGKITTYRKLAESVLERLKPYYPQMKQPWTAGVALPGGDFPVRGVPKLVNQIQADYPFIDEPWALRLVRAYGTQANDMLAGAQSRDDLGQHFDWNLTERELQWLYDKEWARSADDVLWRRSKIGLRLSQAEAAAVDQWFADKLAE